MKIIRGLWFSSFVVIVMLAVKASSPFAADDVIERAVPGPTSPQQPGLRAPMTSIPTMTVEQQLAALQQQVQSLQQQLSMIQSVVKISPGGTIIQAPGLSLVSGSGMMIQSAGSMVVRSGTDMTIDSGSAMAVKSSSTAMIQSVSGMTIEAKGNLSVKGMTTRLNDGTKPVATVGSAVGNGQVMSGSPTLFGN